jgi:predicted DNA-binding protein
MKRETFSEKLELRLPPEWNEKLTAEAERSVTTKSEIARQAIIARLRACEPA